MTGYNDVADDASMGWARQVNVEITAFYGLVAVGLWPFQDCTAAGGGSMSWSCRVKEGTEVYKWLAAVKCWLAVVKCFLQGCS